MENGDKPVTRQELETALARLRDDLKSELFERLHDTETKLLTAFYGFAESNNKRLQQVEGNETLLLSRVVTLESRVLELEKRLNMPPQ